MSCRGLVARSSGRTTRALTARMGILACAAPSPTARSAFPVPTGLVATGLIPFQTSLTPLFRTARVRNAIVILIRQYYDITQVGLLS
jgi:hypothetical protein